MVGYYNGDKNYESRVYTQGPEGVCRDNSGKAFLRNWHLSRDLLKDELEWAGCHSREREGVLQMCVNTRWKGAQHTVGL